MCVEVVVATRTGSPPAAVRYTRYEVAPATAGHDTMTCPSTGATSGAGAVTTSAGGAVVVVPSVPPVDEVPSDPVCPVDESVVVVPVVPEPDVVSVVPVPLVEPEPDVVSVLVFVLVSVLLVLPLLVAGIVVKTSGVE
jgi:hypothetical protein